MSKTETKQTAGVGYELTRKRIKNLNLRIRADGSVAVSVPYGTPQSEVDRFVASRAGWILRHQAAAQQKVQLPAKPLPPKEDCMALFLPICEAVYPLFERVLEGQMPQITLRSMKSRWGSCHPQKKKITLAQQLALMPKEAVEYVIVHEFCHFVHPNHSAAFWALVGSILPDYKARKALLKPVPTVE